ncbi:MAG: WD40 repeat domain-containing protein [Anaerolineae bacterium]|nr:WD40 repeat domain-containing protein [Anaerolineae bacterium]
MYTSQKPGTGEFSAITRLNAVNVKEQAALLHEHPVRSILFSPDNRTLISSMLDSVALWDVEKKRQKARAKVSALNLAFKPDGSTLAIAGRDINFMDMNTGKTVLNMKGHRDGTTGIAFSPDGRLFASGGMDGLVNVGDLKTGRLVASFEHQAQVRGLAFHPDGDRIATISWGDPQSPRSLTLWHVSTGRKAHQLKCGTEKNLSFSPDGRLLAVDGWILDLSTMNQLYDFKERMIAFNPDSTLAASCRSDFNSIGIWDLTNGEQITLLKSHTEGVWCVAFSPDGKWLASSSGKINTHAILKGSSDDAGDNSARIWGVELEETKPLRRMTGRLQPLPGTSRLQPLPGKPSTRPLNQ